MRTRVLLACMALTVLAGCQTNGDLLSETGTPDAGYALSNDPARLGDQHFARGEYGLAERSYRDAVERTPGDVDSWLGLASAYDELRRFDLADRAYERALKLSGATVRYLNNKAYSLMLRGKFQEAGTLLERARRMEPNNPLVQNNLRLLADARAKFRA